jgi:hypothetical protein
MDIRLRPSRLLLAFRLCVCGVALFAVLITGLDYTYKILLCLLALLSLLAVMPFHDTVSSLYIARCTQSEYQNPKLTLVLEMRSKRRIESTLDSYYLFRWVQILYLSSSEKKYAVLVLPDVCSAEEHRQLRQLLSRKF